MQTSSESRYCMVTFFRLSSRASTKYLSHPDHQFYAPLKREVSLILNTLVFLNKKKARHYESFLISQNRAFRTYMLSTSIGTPAFFPKLEVCVRAVSFHSCPIVPCTFRYIAAKNLHVSSFLRFQIVSLSYMLNSNHFTHFSESHSSDSCHRSYRYICLTAASVSSKCKDLSRNKRYYSSVRITVLAMVSAPFSNIFVSVASSVFQSLSKSSCNHDFATKFVSASLMVVASLILQIIG